MVSVHFSSHPLGVRLSPPPLKEGAVWQIVFVRTRMVFLESKVEERNTPRFNRLLSLEGPAEQRLMGAINKVPDKSETNISEHQTMTSNYINIHGDNLYEPSSD